MRTRVHLIAGLATTLACIQTAGCRRAEVDVLKEFPPPRPAQGGSPGGRTWQLDADPESRVEVQFGAEKLDWELSEGHVTLRTNPFNLSGTLKFVPQGSDSPGWRALEAGWGEGRQALGVGVHLEGAIETADDPGHNDPGLLPNAFALRVEIEAHGVRSWLRPKVSLDWQPRDGLSTGQASVVRVRCQRPLTLDPRRHEVSLVNPQKPARPVETVSVGCSLTFHGKSTDVPSSATENPR